MSYFLKITTLAEICIKCVMFVETLQKSPSAWGFASTPLPPAVTAFPPDSQPPEAGSCALKAPNCLRRLTAPPLDRHQLPLKKPGCDTSLVLHNEIRFGLSLVMILSFAISPLLQYYKSNMKIFSYLIPVVLNREEIPPRVRSWAQTPFSFSWLEKLPLHSRVLAAS